MQLRLAITCQDSSWKISSAESCGNTQCHESVERDRISTDQRTAIAQLLGRLCRECKETNQANSIALCTLVAVLAVNASAAQAIYLLPDEHENGELLLHLNATFLLAELLVVELGSHIHCLGGTGLILIQTPPAMTPLSISGTATFTHCLVTGLPSCTVRSPGSAGGTITAGFEGAAHMSGTETLAVLEDEEFSLFIFEGALCPFNEIEAAINGRVVLSLPNGETLAVNKLGTLDDVAGKLFYGAEEAALHGANLATPISVHLERPNGNAWAIKLSQL